MTGDFIEGSTATGVLVSVLNEKGPQHHMVTKESDRSEIESVISGVAGGQYTVSVFVVDEDGLPFHRAATKPRRVSVDDG